jgi:amino acid transporter
MSLMRRLLIGHPLATERIEHEKLGRLGGLAVFAADAVSSVAYGPEEVLIVLVAAGSRGLGYGVPVVVGIAILLAMVATSYRQTVLEYPSGGGAYVVARDNLGVLPSLIAGGALLTDYVLTVSVSVAAGVAAITSAWPILHEHRVAIAVTCVALVMIVNLRGLRESAATFALPVYGFVACVLALIVIGMARMVTGGLHPQPHANLPDVVQPLTLFLVLRAFSSGCASLTGVEAVANGVQAFKEPRGRSAAAVMVWLAVILAVSIVGTTVLGQHLNITPLPDQTVMSQIASQVFGRGGFYFVLQTMTALILILAANTSFADFPRLSAFMARDGYMPRQMMNLGDRLVFANGIVVLAVIASVLIIAFGGDVTRLIPLYAVGVFTAFTTSQSGMVVHWFRKRGPAWRQKAIVNGIGAVLTGVVLGVIATTKFAHGAWIVCILIPLLVWLFLAVHRHYDYVASRLTLGQAHQVRALNNLNVLLVGGMHRGTLEAIQYMKALAPTARAVHIEVGGEAEPRIKRLWTDWEKEIPLLIVPAPYRNIAGALAEYVQDVRRDEGYDMVTIIIPEFVVDHWWEQLLHNNTALLLQFLLRKVSGVSVLNMRYRL